MGPNQINASTIFPPPSPAPYHTPTETVILDWGISVPSLSDFQKNNIIRPSNRDIQEVLIKRHLLDFYSRDGVPQFSMMLGMFTCRQLLEIGDAICSAEISDDEKDTYYGGLKKDIVVIVMLTISQINYEREQLYERRISDLIKGQAFVFKNANLEFELPRPLYRLHVRTPPGERLRRKLQSRGKSKLREDITEHLLVPE